MNHLLCVIGYQSMFIMHYRCMQVLPEFFKKLLFKPVLSTALCEKTWCLEVLTFSSCLNTPFQLIS